MNSSKETHVIQHLRSFEPEEDPYCACRRKESILSNALKTIAECAGFILTVFLTILGYTAMACAAYNLPTPGWFIPGVRILSACLVFGITAGVAVMLRDKLTRQVRFGYISRDEICRAVSGRRKR